MSTVFDQYAGVSDEVTYATGVVPTKFYELTKESVIGRYDRIESEGLRAGTQVDRADRFVPNPKGAAGDLESEVLNQNYASWLKHMLGTVTKTGASAPFTYAGTVGTLKGKSFTTQFNRVDSNGNDNVFTYEGGKITSWELSNSVDGLLILKLSMDFARETIGAGAGVYAKSTATFPANGVLLSFVGATATIAGAAINLSSVSVKGDNGLKVDRFGIRTNGTTKNEPLEDAQRKYEFEFDGEFESVIHAQRVAALTGAGVTAIVSARWQTPDGLHTLQVDMPAARFDAFAVNIGGPGVVTQKLSGKAVQPSAGGSPVTVTVVTPDAAA